MKTNKPFDLTIENLNKTIEDNDIVIMDFWASWCGPCKQFGPIFERVAAKHEGIAFAKVNTEEEQALASQFSIKSIPTVGIFREKILLYLQPGMVPEEGLEELIGKVKELDMDEVRAEVNKKAQTA
jgi:thioredoxin